MKSKRFTFWTEWTFTVNAVVIFPLDFNVICIQVEIFTGGYQKHNKSSSEDHKCPQ